MRTLHFVLLAALVAVAAPLACSDSETPAAPTPDAGVPLEAAVDAGVSTMREGGNYRAYADRVASVLQDFYRESDGLFSTASWWNSANSITALIDYSARTGSTEYRGDLAHTFEKNQAKKFLNLYYDDEGWWALAWIAAYDLTKETRYLDMAKEIFADMTGGWGDTCGGGIWWHKEIHYKNAIANELFFEVAIRLHQRSPGDAGAGSYLDWATREWAWFDKSGMINADNLVNDGLTDDCKNNGQTTWTYNQGVLIGGLVDLSKVTSDAALLTRARAIADASMVKLTDDVGVLHEPCEPGCGGDGNQFKGIFMRHFAELSEATNEPRYRAFTVENAEWAWNAAQDDGEIGLTWSRPLTQRSATLQTSGLDLLNAAIPLTATTPDLAHQKALVPDGAAVTLDLGADVSVGRIVVRRKAAQDFKLRAGATPQGLADVLSITGNDRPVTVHRLDPPLSVRHLRVEGGEVVELNVYRQK